MLLILYSLNALLMIGMPIGLGLWLACKTKAPWLLFGIGAMTFIGSQVVHLPLNAGLTLLFKAIWPSTQPQWWHIPFNAVVLGLTAGLCEETARYVGYRWLAKNARYWRDALMLGAGHGGIEAILLGGYVALTFVNMIVLRQMDLATLGLTGDALAKAQRDVATFWSVPAYLVPLGAVERLFSLTVHISLSVMVLQVFTRRNTGWLALAIGYHWLTDAAAVFGALSGWPPLVIEAVVGMFALVSLAMILSLRPKGEALVPPEPEPVLIFGAPQSPWPASNRKADIDRQLDESKYT
jgi:uncharacterized membrane protein YhfC